jgi:hypothetical protein
MTLCLACLYSSTKLALMGWAGLLIIGGCDELQLK